MRIEEENIEDILQVLEDLEGQGQDRDRIDLDLEIRMQDKLLLHLLRNLLLRITNRNLIMNFQVLLSEVLFLLSNVLKKVLKFKIKKKKILSQCNF